MIDAGRRAALSTDRLPALVLAAGTGTRLDPITRLVAKPAVPLGASTLLEHVLAWLARQHVRDVVINLHHLAATLTTIVGDGTQAGLHVRHSWEQRLLGSAGGPRHALALFDAASFLIVNGDTLCDLDLAPMAEAHLASGADVTMAVVPNPAPDRYNGLVIDAEDRVVGTVTKGPRAVSTWHFVGIQIAKTSVFQRLPDGEPAETVGGIYPPLMAASPSAIRAWRIRDAFIDVGTPREYLRAAQHISGGEAPPAGVVRSVVWPTACVDAGAQLTECIVAGSVHLRAGFRAEQSIVVPASLVRPDDGNRVEIRGDVALFPL